MSMATSLSPNGHIQNLTEPKSSEREVFPKDDSRVYVPAENEFTPTSDLCNIGCGYYFATAAASSNFTERSFEMPSEPIVTP
jgi:hypothetical protein